MPRYIAFFSSINLGSNRLTMADLRYAFEREEFENVETVVASGNVLFDYEDRPTDGLEDMLGHMMADRFDMDCFAAVRNVAQVRQAIEDNPFNATGQDSQVHTHFLSQQPDEARYADLFAAYAGRGPEKLAAGPRSLYVDYVNGVGASRLTGPFIERRLDCRGTARNMRSLRRILEKMEE
jgi:uncharacterized protein (DUF1697 family)